MYENLVKTILNEYNGIIKPIILPSSETNGTGICNSSLFVEGDEIHLIIRHVEYTLYHSEGEQKYQSWWEGPLSYYHREDSRELKTNNFHCILDREDLSIKKYNKVDTSKLDVDPLWEFIGLEDARLVKWFDKYYMCGVRRDTTVNGQGRMELSEIEISDDKVVEVRRNRIDVPGDSYCEKNWMPIIDKPFHFVRWANPTEVVKVNVTDNSYESVFLSSSKETTKYEIRGGTPLIRWNTDKYLCICHEVDFIPKNHSGHKDSDYYHRFVIFNEDYTIDVLSEQFNFMTAKVEFCIGLAEYCDDILITFGFQDNSSYIIRINKDSLDLLIRDKLLREKDDVISKTYTGPNDLKPRNYQLIPLRYDVTETENIKEHIKTYGFVVIKNISTEHQRTHATELLWKTLHTKYGWNQYEPRSWTDDAYNLDGNTKTGLIDISHSDVNWYLRCLDGVNQAFECLYGDDDLVSSFDRMAINRPIECMQKSIHALEQEVENTPYLWSKDLHTHYNIDGFGENISIYYGFMSLSDTDTNTGTTSIVPCSHTPENANRVNQYYLDNVEKLTNTNDPYQYHRIFTECGLVPSPVVLKGGDIMIIDTKLYHCGCPPLNFNSNQLLRVLSVMSMVPRKILSSSILKVRRLYYELEKGTGGSTLGKLTDEEADEILKNRQNDEQKGTVFPKTKQFDNATDKIKQLIGSKLPITDFPSYSRKICDPIYDFDGKYQYNNLI